MEKKELDISIVIPVYNSAGSLEKLFHGIQATLEETVYSYEVIFVEDGSKDKSWSVILALKKAFPSLIKAFKLARNYGQHGATICGLNEASGQWIITIDDDLQTPPKEIAKLIETFLEKKPSLVYGLYPEKKHPWFRNLGSAFIGWVFHYLTDGSMHGGSSFRLMSRELVDQIKQHQDQSVYLDQLIAWYTLDIAYAPVEHHVRPEGKSGYTAFRLIQTTLNIIVHYTDLPLRLMTYTGFILSILSFLIGTYYLVQKWTTGAELGFTSIIVSIFFGVSIILFCLGILGEYIGRLYLSRSNKPLYAIKIRL